MGTAAPGLRRRHGRVDAVGAGLVGGGGHHAPVAGPADDHRRAPQLGPVEQLDRHEEGVHVDVQDRRPDRIRRPVGPVGGHTRVTTRDAQVACPRPRSRSGACPPTAPPATRARGSATHGEQPSRCDAALGPGDPAGLLDDAVGIVDEQLALPRGGLPGLHPQVPAEVGRLDVDLVEQARASRVTTRPVSSATSRARPSTTLSPASMTPPGGLQSWEPSRRRFRTSSSPPGPSISAPPTSQSRIGASVPDRAPDAATPWRWDPPLSRRWRPPTGLPSALRPWVAGAMTVASGTVVSTAAGRLSAGARRRAGTVGADHQHRAERGGRHHHPGDGHHQLAVQDPGEPADPAGRAPP